MKVLLCWAFVLTATLTVAAQGSMEAMLNFSLTNGATYSAISSSVNRSLGWTFQPTVNLEVTALGAFDYILSGSEQIQVGLWNASGVLLASEIINASSTPNNQSLYQSITPALLTANQTYYLAAYLINSPAGSFQFYVTGPDVTDPNGYATMSPEIQLGSAAYTPSAGFAFPSTTEGSGGDAVVAPNFQFQAVPEPSTICPLGIGMAGWLVLRRKVKSPATGV